MTTYNTTINPLLIPALDYIKTLDRDDLRHISPVGFDGGKMASSSWGKLTAHILKYAFAQTETYLVKAGDKYLIYDPTCGEFKVIDVRDLDAMHNTIGETFQISSSALLSADFRKLYDIELVNVVQFSAVFGRDFKAKRGVQFLDGFLTFDARGNEIFTPGYDPTNFATFTIPRRWQDATDAPVAEWDSILSYQGYNAEQRTYINAMIANGIMCDPLNTERAMMFVGMGGTGKSTMLNVIGDVVGSANRHDVDTFDQLLSDRGLYLAPMVYSTVTIVADSSAQFRNKELAKKVLSREKVSYHPYYGHPTEIQPRSQVFLASNDMGIAYQLSDTGIFRRFDIVSFGNVLKSDMRDRTIGHKLHDMRYDIAIMWLKSLKRYIADNGNLERPDWLTQSLRNDAVLNDGMLQALEQLGLAATGPTEHGTIELFNRKVQGLIGDMMREAGESPNKCSSRAVGIRLRNMGVQRTGNKQKGGEFIKFHITDPELLGAVLRINKLDSAN